MCGRTRNVYPQDFHPVQVFLCTKVPKANPMCAAVAAVVYLTWAEGYLSRSGRSCTSLRAIATDRRCSMLIGRDRPSLRKRLWLPARGGAVSRKTAQSICRSRFALGNWWTWTYRDAQGVPSSWERYTVVAAADTTLVIEMASKFEEADPFYAHHRMTLDVADSLAARGSRSQWAFRRFSFRAADDEWRTAPHRDNVQVPCGPGRRCPRHTLTGDMSSLCPPARIPWHHRAAHLESPRLSRAVRRSLVHVPWPAQIDA